MRLVIVVVLAVLFGCSGVKHGLKPSESLTDDQRLEYQHSLIEAQRLMMLGKYSQAVAFYERCLELKAENAAIYFQLANIYITTGNYDKALSYSRNAVKYDDKNEWFLLQLAQIYQVKEKSDSAIYFYERILKIVPYKHEYRMTLAMLYFKAGKLNSSLDLLNKIEADEGISNEIVITKYRIYILKNDSKSCIRLLNGAIKKFPYETQYYGLLGELYEVIGEKDLALENFNKLIDIEPDNEKGFLSIIELYQNGGNLAKAIEVSRSFIGNKQFSSKDKIDVISSFLDRKEFLRGVGPDVKQLIDTLVSIDSTNVKVLVLKVESLVMDKRYRKALDECIKILSISKTEYDVWERTFFVLNNLNDYLGILNLADEATVYFPKNPVFYLYKGMAANQLNNHLQAINTLEKSLKFADGYPQLLERYYSLLGESCNAVKDYTKSDLYFEEAIKLNDRNAVVLNNYSYYLALRGEKLDRALKYIKKCLAIEPNSSTFLDTYAWVLYKQDKLDLAKKSIEKAFIFGGGSNAEILEHYAEILFKEGNRSDALIYYNKIKSLGKESKHLQSLLNIQ